MYIKGQHFTVEQLMYYARTGIWTFEHIYEALPKNKEGKVAVCKLHEWAPIFFAYGEYVEVPKLYTDPVWVVRRYEMGKKAAKMKTVLPAK